jgi:hypothetical protein
MYGFCMIFIVNTYYFLKRRQQVDLCNGEVWCFLCSTDLMLKYHLDELRLQRVKVPVTYFWFLPQKRNDARMRSTDLFFIVAACDVRDVRMYFTPATLNHYFTRSVGV